MTSSADDRDALVRATPTSVADLARLFDTWGREPYDEAVSQLDHGLQCAALARREGEPDALVAAALLHDVGHLIWMAAHDDASVPTADTRHEDIGADALAALFGEGVAGPVRLHVLAKRVLLATDPDYAGGLSAGSRASAVRQGGAASPEEVDAFRARPAADAALRLRRHDDAGKVVGLEVLPFEDYRPLLERLSG